MENNDDFIVVGNIPFTINDDTSYKNRGRSKNIGDDFIKLISNLTKNGKFTYILRANFETNAFKNNIILNDNFIKMVYHDKPIFDISNQIRTCHVVGDSTKKSDSFEYKSNTEPQSIRLLKQKNLVISKNIEKSFLMDPNTKTLGDIWYNGTRLMGGLNNTGKYKTIESLGSYKTDEFNWQYDESESTLIGKWKVLVPYKGGGRAIKIAGPEYSITRSIVGLATDSLESAIKLKKWMLEFDILTELNELRVSCTNSKSLFSKIIIPDEII